MSDAWVHACRTQAYVDFTHPDDLLKSDDYASSIDTGGRESKLLEKRHIRNGGEIVWVTLRSTTIRNDEGEFLYALTLIENVTERKLAEQALKAKENELQTLADNVAAWIAYVDKEQRYQFVNQAYQELYGIDVGQILGKHISEIIPAGAYEKSSTYIEAALAGDQVSFQGPLGDDPGGGNRIVLRTLVPDRGSDGQVRGFFSIATEITELKQAEAQLQGANARLHTNEGEFATVLESAPEGVVVSDRDGVIVLVNAETERLFGYDRRELIGMSVQSLVPDSMRAGHEQLRSGYLAEGRSRSMGGELDLHARRKDGTEVSVEISLNAISIEGDSHVLAMVRDVTERKAQAERSAQSERLEAIGQLAGGVAHDFNNILTVIQGHGSLANDRLEAGTAFGLWFRRADRRFDAG